MAAIPLLQWLPSLFLLSLFGSQSSAMTNPPPSFIKSVNLGGWLVVKGLMTPWLFDNITNKDLLDGTRVQLISPARSTYLTAERGGGAAVIANRTSASGWETFKLWRITDSTFKLRVLHNQFIGLDDNRGLGSVVATAISPDEGGTFEIVIHKDQNPDLKRVRLRAPNNLFLQANADGSVTANAQESTSWGDDDLSVFDMAIVSRMKGEYQLTNGYGKEMASRVLRKHWSSYIVENDFEFMSRNGINAVRIPVGHWIADGDNPPGPFVGGSLTALDNALTWAEKHGIKVIVDLHAPQDSQNGKDHSGSRDGSLDWGKTQESIDNTVKVIDFLSKRYAQRNSFIAMELLNEPHASGVSLISLKTYYQAGYDTVRKYCPPTACYVIMSNRLQIPDNSPELLRFAGALNGTVLDVHYFNLFSDKFTKKTVQENIDYVNNQRASDIRSLMQSYGPLLYVGEWTAHLVGASDLDAKRFAAAELDVFGRASFGWGFWSYKNYNPQWSFVYMIQNDLISMK